MSERSPAVSLIRNAGVACFFGVFAPVVVLGIFTMRQVRRWTSARAKQVRSAAKGEREKWR